MSQPATYEPLGGERHRHGAVEHSHPHAGPHDHDDAWARLTQHARHEHDRASDEAHSHHHGDHGHSHGLVHDSIKRSREGLRAVAASLAVLGLAALAQTAIFVLSGSVALLADLIHNFGDALTAVPLAVAFLLRSERAERGGGLFVVAAIFISACVAASRRPTGSSTRARRAISAHWPPRAPSGTSRT